MQASDLPGDRTEISLDPATARVLTGLRLAVVAHDQDRAHRLATSLRGWDVTVEVLRAAADASLQAARQIDPEVVLLDPTDLGGAGLSMTRRLEADERLRWASVLRCELGVFWPDEEDRPDLRKLASLLSPLVQTERTLRMRIESEVSMIVELDGVGPNRALRVLASSEHAWAITVQSPDARAELLVRGGEVATATYEEVHTSAPPLRGDLAKRRFLAMRTGVLELTRLASPSLAGIDDITTHRLAPPPELLVAARDQVTSPSVADAFGSDEDATIVEAEPPGAKYGLVAPPAALVDDATTPPVGQPLPSADGVPPDLEEVPTRPRGPAPTGETVIAAPIGTPVVAAPSETPVVAAPSETPVVPAPIKTPVVPAPSETPVVPAPIETPVAPRIETPVASRRETPVTPRKSPERPASSRFILLAAVGAGLGAIAVVVVVMLASSSGDDAESAPTSAEEAPPAIAPPSQETQQAVAPPTPEPSPTPAPENPAPNEPVAELPAELPSEPPPEQPTAEAAPSPAPNAGADALIAEADALRLPREAARARDLYEQARTLDPMSPEAYAGIARTYLAQDRPDDAMAPAERAAGLAPNRASFKILVGDVHLARGNVDAARTIWLEVNATRSTVQLRRRLERIGALPSPEGEAPAENEAEPPPPAP